MTEQKATPFSVQMGRRLRLARTMNGLGQRDVAAMAGVSYQQVQRYENGTDRITAERLDEISKGLNAPVTFFFGYDDEELPNQIDGALVLAGRIRSLPDKAIRLSIDQLVLAIGDAWKRHRTN